MICNQCGNQIPDDAKFCNKCGDTAAAAAERKPQPPKKKTPPELFIGAAAFLCLAVAGFGVQSYVSGHGGGGSASWLGGGDAQESATDGRKKTEETPEQQLPSYDYAAAEKIRERYQNKNDELCNDLYQNQIVFHQDSFNSLYIELPADTDLMQDFQTIRRITSPDGPKKRGRSILSI